MAKAGFDSKTPLMVVQATRAGNRETWGLTADLTYTAPRKTPSEPEQILTVPPFTRTDFASVPGFLTWLTPVSGTYARAAVLHDYLCDQVHESEAHGVKPSIERHNADGLFRQAMGTLGVPTIQRYVLWVAVRFGSLGPPWSGKFWRLVGHGPRLRDWLGILYVLACFLTLVGAVIAAGAYATHRVVVDVWPWISDDGRSDWVEWPMQCVTVGLSPLLIAAQVIAVAMWLYFAEWLLWKWTPIRMALFSRVPDVPGFLRWLRGGPLRAKPAFWWKPVTGKKLKLLQIISDVAGCVAVIAILGVALKSTVGLPFG